MNNHYPLFTLFFDYYTHNGYNKSILSGDMIHSVDLAYNSFHYVALKRRNVTFVHPGLDELLQEEYDFLGASIGGGEI